jgi:hypothetical protein
MRRVITTALLAIGALAAGVTPAFPYGTVVGLGQNAEHERMTRRALSCPPATASTGICFETASIGSLAGGSASVGAVGYPDISSYINDGAYHCDGGDSYPIAGYPQSASAAAAKLRECRAVIDSRLDEAAAAAARMLGPKNEILADQVDLSTSCTFVGGSGGRAKCDVLWHLGIALHVTQDFYAHSNWADRADLRGGRLVGVDNPDGFGRGSRAPFLDVRGSPGLPRGLVTGCFGLPEGATCNYGGLLGFEYARVKHLNLNKDEGTINPTPGGTLGSGTTPRGSHSGNFARSVIAAMDDTSDKWATLRERLVAAHGAVKAALMICALVRDDPARACQGRVVGLAIDSSGSNSSTDPLNLRITAGQSLASALTSAADAGAGGVPDLLTVIDFDSSASVLYPPGDPDAAIPSIAGIDASGGTFIAGGITTTLGSMTPLGPPADRSGIVVLTDGEDSDVAALTAAIGNATARGVRVSFGFLSPPTLTNEASLKRSDAVSPDVQRAIIASGGVFGTIASAAGQQTFVDLVRRRGITAVDSIDGSDDGGAVALGLEVSGTLSSKDDRDTWRYSAAPGEGIRATLTPPGGVVQAFELRDDDGRITAAGSSPSGSPVILRARLPRGGQLRLTVDGDPGVYLLRLDADSSAPALPRPRLAGIAVPPVTVRGMVRVSLSPRFQGSTRTIPRNRATYLGWRIRARKAGKVQVQMVGPRGYRRTISGRVSKGQKTLSARLSSVGRRKGPWRIDLISNRRVISSVIVRTR